MKEADNIVFRYRNQINDLVENQSDLNAFHALERIEIDEIWDEIAFGLEIDEVWDDILSDLDSQLPVNSGWGVVARYSALILLTVIGVILTRQSLQDPMIRPGIPEINERIDQIEEMNNKNPLNLSGNNELLDPFETVFIAAVSDTGMIDNEAPLLIGCITDPVFIAPPESSPVKANEFSQLICPERFNKVTAPFNPNPDIRDDYHDFFFSGSTEPVMSRGRFSTGISALLKNTWLLNQETLDGFKSETFNTTLIVFYPDVGLSVNYSLNGKLLLQADAYLYSSTGQSYYDYIYGYYSKKTITLNYLTIALSLKYKLILEDNKKGCSSINLIAGGYGSSLRRANLIINDDIDKVRSQYCHYDYGIRLGSELELFISDHLSLAPGVFFSVGIPNIQKKSTHIPHASNRTWNGSSGLQFAIYYYFD